MLIVSTNLEKSITIKWNLTFPSCLHTDGYVYYIIEYCFATRPRGYTLSLMPNSTLNERGSSKSAHLWIFIIFCMLNTYTVTTTKMKLFYSSKAVRPQGGTLMYTLFELIYDLLNISLNSLTLLIATFFE